MQLLKNIVVGFAVSFLGSVPLGYLNVIGYDIFSRSGIAATVAYLLGVISIEAIVIYSTLIFAGKLIRNKKLIQWIEGFSVVFMFAIAYVFYISAGVSVSRETALHRYEAYSPYVIGIVLSCFNFIQIPFWTSWNLYLLNGNYIEITRARKYFYVLGTVCGTFAGMMVLILFLDFLTGKTGFFSRYLMKVIIPLGFLALGIFQGVKFYRKYLK